MIWFSFPFLVVMVICSFGAYLHVWKVFFCCEKITIGTVSFLGNGPIYKAKFMVWFAIEHVQVDHAWVILQTVDMMNLSRKGPTSDPSQDRSPRLLTSYALIVGHCYRLITLFLIFCWLQRVVFLNLFFCFWISYPWKAMIYKGIFPKRKKKKEVRQTFNMLYSDFRGSNL